MRQNHVGDHVGQLDLLPHADVWRAADQIVRPSGYKGLYAFHKYWGKKPAEPITFLAERFCPKNGIILDPFLGSGLMTRISFLANRRFIGIDINPVSVELGKLFHNLPTYNDYTQAVNHVINRVKSTIDRSYQRSDGSIATHFLWDGESLLSTWTNGSRKRIENDATLHDVTLSESFSGYKPTLLREITTFSNSRINSTPNLNLLDIFKPRACANMEKLLHCILSIQDPTIRRSLLLTLTAASGQMSNFVFAIGKRGKRRGRTHARTEVGSWAIGFWRPKKHFEVNVLNCFVNKSRKLQKALLSPNQTADEPWTDQVVKFFAQNMKCALVQGSSQTILHEIPDNSIDLILADPPHGDRIPYLELSEFWNSILQFSCSDFENEIVVSNALERKKTVAQYVKTMRDMLRSFGRVLKHDGVLCVIFNCRDDEKWRFLVDPPGLYFVGCFDFNYSSGSIVQDNRKGALRSDLALVFRRPGQRNRIEELEKLPGWSSEFPVKFGGHRVVGN